MLYCNAVCDASQEVLDYECATAVWSIFIVGTERVGMIWVKTSPLSFNHDWAFELFSPSFLLSHGLPASLSSFRSVSPHSTEPGEALDTSALNLAVRRD